MADVDEEFEGEGEAVTEKAGGDEDALDVAEVDVAMADGVVGEVGGVGGGDHGGAGGADVGYGFGFGVGRDSGRDSAVIQAVIQAVIHSWRVGRSNRLFC